MLMDQKRTDQFDRISEDWSVEFARQVYVSVPSDKTLRTQSPSNKTRPQQMFVIKWIKDHFSSSSRRAQGSLASHERESRLGSGGRWVQKDGFVDTDMYGVEKP
jgi:hypothetical protein